MYQSLLMKNEGGIYNPKGLSEKKAKEKFVGKLSNMRQYSGTSRRGKPIGKREALDLYNTEKNFTDRLQLNRIKSFDRYKGLRRPKKELPPALQLWRDFLSLDPWIKGAESFKDYLKRNGKRRLEFEFFKKNIVEYLQMRQPSASGERLTAITRLMNKYHNLKGEYSRIYKSLPKNRPFQEQIPKENYPEFARIRKPVRVADGGSIFSLLIPNIGDIVRGFMGKK